ncbi:MAG: EamA family transporter [Chitinophagaceae bacterium]|nr:EamA family transporter [Chitinophagaceae bacterium]
MNRQIEPTASTYKVVLAFAILYIVWGSTYFFIQRALNGFPPLMLGCIRFLAAGILMLIWSLLRGENVWNVNDIKHAALSGVLLLFVGNGAVIWVEQYMPSAMVAIVISSSPIWFILLDKPKWKENFQSKATIAGLVIGFAGVVLLFGEKIAAIFSTLGSGKELAGMALLIIGAISWSGGSLISKYKAPNIPATVNTTWQMLAAGFAFLPIALLHGEASKMDFAAVTTSAWLSLLYLIFFGSIAGFSAYVWLLKVKPVTQVSTYAYVNPVVAVLLGVFFAGERITFIQIFGLAIILASVFLINLVKYTKAKALQKKEDRLILSS